MKKDTIYTIIVVAVLLVTVYIALIVVGLVDNPLAPNHFVGSWIGTSPVTGEHGTWTFQRPMLGRWGTGEMVGFTSFEYKYTDTELILRFPDPSITPSTIIFDYSFSSDYSLFILTYGEYPFQERITFVRIE